MKSPREGVGDREAEPRHHFTLCATDLDGQQLHLLHQTDDRTRDGVGKVENCAHAIHIFARRHFAEVAVRGRNVAVRFGLGFLAAAVAVIPGWEEHGLRAVQGFSVYTLHILPWPYSH